MDRLAEQHEQKIWQKCQAGHDKHELTKVLTILGKLWVYNWERYKDYAGYCTGQDDISRTLMNTGVWEPSDTSWVERVLREAAPGLVLDIGAHIGWYSLIAAKAGHRVVAIEASEENIELLVMNAAALGLYERIQPIHEWIGPGPSRLRFGNDEIELVIIDIEGSEEHAVELLASQFKCRLIKHALIEISPTFNDRYPALVERLQKWGYEAKKDGQPWDGKFDFEQANFLFTRAGL